MGLDTQDVGSREAVVAVIVINYGTWELAVEAVQSVLSRQHENLTVEIHLVDNASPNGDASHFEAVHESQGWGDRVQLWLEPVNHGFGRGNNRVLTHLAARQAPPDYVFLLNPDAQLENEAIAVLARALATHPEAVAAGAGIHLPDGTPAVACFRFPNLLSEMVSAVNFGPLTRLFPRAQVPISPDYDGKIVDWVAGAAVLMRFETLRHVGFFDPDFFLYYEEVELMYRLAQKEYKTLYIPAAKVLHLEGAATQVRSGDKRPKRRPSFVYASWRMYFEKTHGRCYALITSIAKYGAAGLGLCLSALRRRPSTLPVRFFRDHWTYAIRPLLLGRAQ